MPSRARERTYLAESITLRTSAATPNRSLIGEAIPQANCTRRTPCAGRTVCRCPNPDPAPQVCPTVLPGPPDRAPAAPSSAVELFRAIRCHQGDDPRRGRGTDRVHTGLVDRTSPAHAAVFRLRRRRFRQELRGLDSVRRHPGLTVDLFGAAVASRYR